VTKQTFIDSNVILVLFSTPFYNEQPNAKATLLRRYTYLLAEKKERILYPSVVVANARS
jgi:hypothetical protein